MLYGDDFPVFIGGFAPAADVPYLSDVARLERAWSEAYHALDACSLQTQVLSRASPAALLNKRVTLHPSVRIAALCLPRRRYLGGSSEAGRGAGSDALVRSGCSDRATRLRGAGSYAG